MIRSKEEILEKWIGRAMFKSKDIADNYIVRMSLNAMNEYALQFTNKIPENNIHNCIFFDEAQGRNKCVHPKSKTQKCKDICDI